MNVNSLDTLLIDTFPSCVVRKDLLARIKKGTNVPSFVLEFLLAKYCATDDAAEIEAGIAAVVETIQKQYVRADESNRAQSLVEQQGRHKFIDKIHVSYVEKEKKHWAAMENFNSRRIAVANRFYRDNDRLLEGGIWAEVVLGYNPSEDDDHAFVVEELKPIQLARFDYETFCAGRGKFTRNEWRDVILRSIGLEPERMDDRLKLHFLARLVPFVEANYNFIELGPRGTGKSYVFSEFSPYVTLISGGQTSTSVLFYNNQRRRVGIIGFWDVVAFDEVGGIKVKDRDTVQIMKDYMANGRFSRGPAEVTADASMCFVGNIDESIASLVHNPAKDLFEPLPEAFDLAVIHRFHNYLPGWEIPANSDEYLTRRYGFITDYIAEAFHYSAKHVNRFAYAKSRVRIGPQVAGRDETAVLKTVSGLLKLLHPGCEPTASELDEYTAYALEGRRRVKEQLHKRKADGEFADLDFFYLNADGREVRVACRESDGIPPVRDVFAVETSEIPTSEPLSASLEGPGERHYTIRYGDIGHDFTTIYGVYTLGASKVAVQDPYIRQSHQIWNFTRFCEVMVQAVSIRTIELITGSDDPTQEVEMSERLDALTEDLREHDINLVYRFDHNVHDREVHFDNGWVVKVGRGMDIYQRTEKSRSGLGGFDLKLRPCLETTVDSYKMPA